MKKRFECSPLLFLLVFSYVLIEGSFDPLLVVGFSLLHELGHWLIIKICGGTVGRISGSGRGFSMAVNGLSYRGELFAALAGPLASLLLACGFWIAAFLLDERILWFSCYANLALAAINLLPIFPLDGGRALAAGLALCCPLEWQQRITRGIGLTLLLPLLAVAFRMFLTSGYNISLLLICIYLLGLIKENGI